MVERQVTGPEKDSPNGPSLGRVAQRRRTRAAIVAAAVSLVSAGRNPSVEEIAAAADVSRRTVYMHFPTLDQLLLDATVGALSAQSIDAVLAPDVGDAADRVDALVRTLTGTASSTLPLGRKIIRLTVDAPEVDDTTGVPRRGFRRLEWIERAIEPLRDEVTAEQFERLRDALAVIAGWEAMIVLRDVCGLEHEREEAVMRWAAGALVAAIVAERSPAEAEKSSRRRRRGDR